MEYTVVLPTLNAEKTLVPTLNSVLRQIHRPREIIICDQGSTDKTLSMLEALVKPVTVISKSLNEALEQVTTNYLSLIRPGDIWSPQKISRQIESIRDGDICTCFTHSPIKNLNSKTPEGFTLFLKSEHKDLLINQVSHFPPFKICPFELIEVGHD